MRNGKEYDLCENCKKVFDEFMDNEFNKPISDDELHNILIKDSDTMNDNFHIKAHGGNNNGNQYTSYTIDDHVMPIENSIQIGNMLKPIKSDMIIGNLHIYNSKKFNKFEKFMWKKFFGFEIEDVEKISWKK